MQRSPAVLRAALMIGVALASVRCAKPIDGGDGGGCLTPLQQDEVDNYEEIIHPGVENTPVTCDQGQLVYSFTATPWPPTAGANETFTLKVTYANSGMPVTGAAIEGQVWAPDGVDQMEQTNETEVGNGVYTIQDVSFATPSDWSGPGTWLVKFHTEVGDPSHGGIHNHAKFAFVVQ